MCKEGITKKGPIVKLGVLALLSLFVLLGAYGKGWAWKQTDHPDYVDHKQKVGEDYKQIILDKEYKIEKGEKEGTYKVTWGDESLVWVPKPWEPPSLQKEGPAFYDRWIQPDLPFPWEDPLPAREKYSGPERHDRSYTPLYFNEFGDNYMTYWRIMLRSPKGTVIDRTINEWMVAYRRNPEGLPEDLQGKVRARYMFSFVSPDDFRALGMTTTVYSDPKKMNDEFLYTSSTRKVRRLPQAARQDFIPGSIARWEDFPQVKPFPDIQYKVIGSVLYKGQPDGTYGFGSEFSEDVSSTENPGFDGVGEPCVILELIPPKGYWYARQERIIGLKTGSSWYEQAWDEKGQLVRWRVNRRSYAKEDPRLQFNPGLADYELIWGGEYFVEPLTGYKMVWNMIKFWINFPEMPRNIVGIDNLLKEPVKQIKFWE